MLILKSGRSFIRKIKKAPSESVMVIVATRLENVEVLDYSMARELLLSRCKKSAKSAPIDRCALLE